jgi:hypothetical protein
MFSFSKQSYSGFGIDFRRIIKPRRAFPQSINYLWGRGRGLSFDEGQVLTPMKYFQISRGRLRDINTVVAEFTLRHNIKEEKHGRKFGRKNMAENLKNSEIPDVLREGSYA